MRKSFLRFALAFTAVAVFALTSCGPKDADVQKAVSEKIAAVSSEVTGGAATVKDGVVTLTGEFKDEMSKSALETAVKAVPGVKSVVNNGTIAPPPPAPVVAPVVVAADDPLTKGVTDAIKDFPGVKADVKDGVVTLTGDIKRSSLQKLMMGLNTLKPKKIDNKLTIK